MTTETSAALGWQLNCHPNPIDNPARDGLQGVDAQNVRSYGIGENFSGGHPHPQAR